MKDQPHNRVVCMVRQGKKLRMIEAKESDWMAISQGEGIGSGRQHKEVEQAFFLNPADEIVIAWEKPVDVDMLYNISVEKARDDAFDKGWKSAKENADQTELLTDELPL